MLEVREGMTLPEALDALDRSRLDRPAEVVRGVLEEYDYRFKETLKNRLEVLPAAREPDPPRLQAKMSLMPGQVYQLVTEERELALHREEAFGVGAVRVDHRTFSLREGDRRVGRIDQFPNHGFVFTNKEPCLALSVVELDGRRWYHYRSALKESWWSEIPYAVTTDAGSGELVALTIEGAGWFLSTRHLKMFAECEPIHVPLLAALHHGLVFRNSG